MVSKTPRRKNEMYWETSYVFARVVMLPKLAIALYQSKKIIILMS